MWLCSEKTGGFNCAGFIGYRTADEKVRSKGFAGSVCIDIQKSFFCFLSKQVTVLMVGDSVVPTIECSRYEQKQQ